MKDPSKGLLAEAAQAQYLRDEFYALARQDNHVLDLLESALVDGLWLWDIECRDKVWFSSRLKGFFGYADSELSDCFSWLVEHTVAQDRENLLQAFWQHSQVSGLPFDGVVRYTHRDGSAGSVRVRATAVRDGTGQVARMLGALSRFSHPEQEGLPRLGEPMGASPAEPPASTPSLVELAEMVPHLIWTCSGDGACDYLSPQWVAYTGLPANTQLGYGWLERIHPEDRIVTQQHWAEAASTGGVFDTEFRIRRFDGTYRWFKTRATPVRGPHGDIVKWFGSNTDVQDLRDTQHILRCVNVELEERVRERTAELTRANAALKSVASKLGRAQRITQVGSWSLDIATGNVEWSEELFRIVGLPPEVEPPNYAVQTSLFMPESWARLTAAIEHSVRTGEGYELRLAAVRPSGEVRHAIARAQAVLGEAGSVVSLVGTFQDITELHLARRERDQAAERAHLATSAANLGIWDWDILANKLNWDQQMYRLYGVREEDFEGAYAAWEACLHPDDLRDAIAAVEFALAGENAFDTAFRVVRPSGEIRLLRGSAQVHRDEHGSAVRMIGVNWDVTREWEAERALRANEALLQQFVQHAPAAIAMLDNQMRYLQTSERWIRDYRLTENVIGRSHYDVFPDVPERWKEIHRRVLAGAVESCAEDPFPRANGSTDWLQWEARPWLTPDGAVGGLIFFTQVVTERKLLELKLVSQKTELERSNRDLEQFAYSASHDLQEPLRAVSGCAQILQRNYEGQLDAAADALIGHVVAGAARMQALIHDLLTYSRVATHAAVHRKIAVAFVVTQALRNLTSAVEAAGAKTTVGELPTVVGDATQLTQLFQNLLSNALKYRGPQATEIRISAVQKAQEWVFEVSDNGIGIESAYFERIFVLFQRLHTRVEYPGTGIGLALCKKIIERHHGRIWVESTLGRGSTFYFTLPVAP